MANVQCGSPEKYAEEVALSGDLFCTEWGGDTLNRWVPPRRRRCSCPTVVRQGRAGCRRASRQPRRRGAWTCRRRCTPIAMVAMVDRATSADVDSGAFFKRECSGHTRHWHCLYSVPVALAGGRRGAGTGVMHIQVKAAFTFGQPRMPLVPCISDPHVIQPCGSRRDCRVHGACKGGAS